MRVVIITPPVAIVSLEEAKAHLRVLHADEDALIASLIEVATGWLDGPTGWLGRCLGEQVLEAVFPTDLDPTVRSYPFPPFLALVSEVPSVDARTVAVRYRAGYVAPGSKSTVPAPIRHAILLMVGHLFNNREAVLSAAGRPAQLPLGIEALLAPYRIFA